MTERGKLTGKFGERYTYDLTVGQVPGAVIVYFEISGATAQDVERELLEGRLLKGERKTP